MKLVPSTNAKVDALRAAGTLNGRPERVVDPLFHGLRFFDARDLVQVKYEMLRCVEREQVSVQRAARTFGSHGSLGIRSKPTMRKQAWLGCYRSRGGPNWLPQKNAGAEPGPTD